MKKVVILWILAAIISATSIIGSSVRLQAPEEFVIKSDEVTMSNWEMEPTTYAGKDVTKITIGSTEISGLHLSPLGVDAESFRGSDLVIYATYVEATVHGITSGWEGGDIPHQSLELLLPHENAVQENVVMHVLYQRVESAKLSGVVIKSSPSQPDVVTQPYSWMEDWNYEGPISYTSPQGEKAKVTEITAEEIEGPLTLSWKYWKQTAAKTVQKDVLVYSTFTQGSAYNMSFGWRGDREPPSLKSLPNPGVMEDVSIRPVYIEAAKIELNGMELKIS